MRIAIGTTSELKIRALKMALDKIKIEAEILSVKANSGVSDEPFGYEETIKGAKNRAKQSLEEKKPDLAVGIENGLIKIEENYFDIACIYIVSKEGEESLSFSSGYFVPDWAIKEIKEKNTELGEITKKNLGDSDKDPVKFFSNGTIRRDEWLSQSVLFALMKIFNKEKYIKP